MPSKKTLKRKSVGKVATTKPMKKNKSTRPKTAKQYSALSEVQQETWNRGVHVHSKMLSGTSLTEASREFGISPNKVKALLGSALQKKKGRYVAKPNDKLLRVLVIPSSEGLKEVAVRGSKVASTIAAYSDAVQKYLRTGDSSSLRKFKRIKLMDESEKRIKLLTDLTELQKLGSAGVLSFESLYRRAA